MFGFEISRIKLDNLLRKFFHMQSYENNKYKMHAMQFSLVKCYFILINIVFACFNTQKMQS